MSLVMATTAIVVITAYGCGDNVTLVTATTAIVAIREYFCFNN